MDNQLRVAALHNDIRGAYSGNTFDPDKSDGRFEGIARSSWFVFYVSKGWRDKMRIIMKKFIITAVIMVLFITIQVFCAEIDGQWVGVANDKNGKKMEFRYRFKAEGNTLIGLIESQLGSGPITEGKIDGNAIEFIVPGNGYAIINTGTLSGDEIHLTGTIGTEKQKAILKRIKYDE